MTAALIWLGIIAICGGAFLMVLGYLSNKRKGR